MITTPNAVARPAAMIAAASHAMAEETAARRAMALSAAPDGAGAETEQAVKPVGLAEAPRRYVAEREAALRENMQNKAAKQAMARPVAPEDQPEPELEMLPPPATEVTAKGGRQSRTDARAEIFEAEARLRVLNRASSGYAVTRALAS